MDDKEFEQTVFEIAAEAGQEEFRPFVFYNDGGEIEVFGKQDSYYGEWINPHLTLYRSEVTNEIIGCCIHDAAWLMMQEKSDKCYGM